MKMNLNITKRVFKLGLLLIVATGLVAVSCFYYVKSNAKDYLYNDVTKIPYNDVALVLGTSKYGRVGGVNPYFKYRMEAAYLLYKEGKVKHIIVSGDNHIDGYNEPEQMKQYLIKLGVKAKHITLDYAGLRTLDSVIRAKEIFGQKSFTIISQKFHNERAIFISRKNNIDVVAFNSKTPPMSKQMKIREFLAKTKAVLDIYLLKTNPKFLGEKIEIKL
jgi:SanA protein